MGQRREEGNRFRECRRGHQRRREDNEEELCIIKAGLNEICMQIHLSGIKLCCRVTMENNASVPLLHAVFLAENAQDDLVRLLTVYLSPDVTLNLN